MSRTPSARPTRAALAVLATIGAVVLAGCGAGQISQTAYQSDGSGGASGSAGPIQVQDVKIEFGEEAEGAAVHPRGGNAPVQAWIVNTGGEPDELVSASSPAAASVEISGETMIYPGIILVAEGEPTEAAAPPPGGPAEPVAPSPAPPTAASGEQHEAHIVMTGLREDIQAGINYELVLVFANAGEVRLPVPVANSPEPRESGH